MDIAVLSDIHGNYEALKTCIQYLLIRWSLLRSVTAHRIW